MLPVMLTHVNDLMIYRFELELCIKIISDIVDLLFETNRLVRQLPVLNCFELELMYQSLTVIEVWSQTAGIKGTMPLLTAVWWWTKKKNDAHG